MSVRQHQPIPYFILATLCCWPSASRSARRLPRIPLFLLVTLCCWGGLLLLVLPASAITRDEVMTRARAYAYHPWRCTTQNLTASCSATYKSAYVVGDQLGLPYDWGGYLTLFDFDQKIAQGLGAGSPPQGSVLDCTVGLDCSGFVSKCWDTGHNTTSSLGQISSVITVGDLLAGDAFNSAGYHVVLYSHTLQSGDPVFFEAGGYNVHINASGGWSLVSGFTPLRYKNIVGSTTTDPLGTSENPILINSFPYTDSRDTSLSASDVLDGCGLASGSSEAGPELIYQVTFTQPGLLTVAVSDDANTDIDVHLYTSMNTGDCIARHDSSFSAAVDCGTYYIVADTFRNSSGVELPGAYSLMADFAPSTGPCGSGPPAYDPPGAVGDACGYPAQPDLPFCNENLGGEICIYTTQPPTTSFCSMACQIDLDCTKDFPGGCCQDISGKKEYYCLPASFCVASPDGGIPDAHIPGDDLSHTDSQTPSPGDAGIPDDGSTQDLRRGDGLPPGNADPAGPVDHDEGGCSCHLSRQSLPPGQKVFWVALTLLLFGGHIRATRSKKRQLD